MESPRHKRPSTELVPVGASALKGNAAWYIGLAFAAAMTLWSSVLGAVFFAGILRIQVESFGSRALAIAAAISAAIMVALGVAYGAPTALAPLTPVVCGLCLVPCMWRHRADVTAVFLTIAFVTVLGLACDEVLAFMQGTDIATVTFQALMDSIAIALGTGIEAEMLASSMEPVAWAFWPLVYVANAALYVMLAAIGSFLAVSRKDTPAPQIDRFDAPMWAVGVLALAVLGLGVALSGIAGAEYVLPLAATVLMSVRFIFALQGFGVLCALLNRSRMGCATRIMAIFLGIWFETMFLVMSIVGLIDVWANFRKLNRGGAHSEQDE